MHHGLVDKTIYSLQGQRLREVLKGLRRGAGLTQRQLAARLNREQNFINRLELGERRLDLVEFYWFCRACNAKPETIAKEVMREFDLAHNAIGSPEKEAAAPGGFKNPAAVALGRLGGLRGGSARAKKLTLVERKSIARQAAAARWKSRNKA